MNSAGSKFAYEFMIIEGWASVLVKEERFSALDAIWSDLGEQLSLGVGSTARSEGSNNKVSRIFVISFSEKQEIRFETGFRKFPFLLWVIKNRAGLASWKHFFFIDWFGNFGNFPRGPVKGATLMHKLNGGLELLNVTVKIKINCTVRSSNRANKEMNNTND